MIKGKKGATSKVGGDHLKKSVSLHGKEIIFSNLRKSQKFEYFPFS